MAFIEGNKAGGVRAEVYITLSAIQPSDELRHFHGVVLPCRRDCVLFSRDLGEYYHSFVDYDSQIISRCLDRFLNRIPRLAVVMIPVRLFDAIFPKIVDVIVKNEADFEIVQQDHQKPRPAIRSTASPRGNTFGRVVNSIAEVFRRIGHACECAYDETDR